MGHRYRGIGEVTKQVTNNLLVKAVKNRDEVIFYEYDINQKSNDPKEMLDLPIKLKYEEVFVGKNIYEYPPKSEKEKIRQILKMIFSNSQIKDSNKADVFLQFSYEFGVPVDTKTILVFHDLIPLIMKEHYFNSPLDMARRLKVRSAIRAIWALWSHKSLIKTSLKRAFNIVAISESTKNDLQKYFKIKKNKISVSPLGVDIKVTKTFNKDVTKAKLPEKPYLLFVGGTDFRRRIPTLVHGFEKAKKEVPKLKLVLAGRDFVTQIDGYSDWAQAIRNSASKKDILTFGYIDDKFKQKLFKNAVAFVLPTLYEGFGLPIVESYLYGCPVISYKNSSLTEVGGKYAEYINDDVDEMAHAIKKIFNESANRHAQRIKEAEAWARNFTWENTSDNIYNIITMKKVSR